MISRGLEKKSNAALPWVEIKMYNKTNDMIGVGE
jgi:hypothetical protein